MENKQQPSEKRTRSDSASSSASAQSSSHPTKAIKTQTHFTTHLTEEEISNTSHPQPSPASHGDEENVSKTEPPNPAQQANSPLTELKKVQDDPLANDSTTQATAASVSEADPQSEAKPVVYSNGDWEAVYDPQTNAYFFANSKTGETTWTNPLAPPEPSSSRAPQPLPDLGGIDPELAHLDPQMARIMHAHSSQTEPRFAARFNAKTGRFEADPTRDPSRVSEYAKARSQAEAFFDVDSWEKTLEKHNGRVPGTSKETRAAALEQGKKLSKAELNQFKQQKQEKKARNQRAWLI
ncbi:hypothetical protein PCASD_02191 [Puccinia coronata f. sp. avenae]|uniref:WW domain-containing protein n=1 Tax=Puccinia coronata f. sp. avenae TaxID=200324 RepID=A0A2N5VHY7_9BASI|nr:hypothetical protein PCASD_02191 [Puccinia coronata f. sp. avenae]